MERNEVEMVWKVNGIPYRSYCYKKTKTAASLEKDCNLIMSHHVSSNVSAIEHVISKAVSKTTISLKIMQEMDAEMHNLVKEKYGIESKGMKELRIVFKHYILAYFNINVETKVPHTDHDM
eukprot:12301765-Ditylum_brightwellii.AAC.1